MTLKVGPLQNIKILGKSHVLPLVSIRSVAERFKKVKSFTKKQKKSKFSCLKRKFLEKFS